MLTAPQPLSSSVGINRAVVGNGRRRLSPTPSEQSYQTIGTNPASLFSVSQADVASDSLSLATIATGDLVGGGLWERQDRKSLQPMMPFGCAFVRAQPPSFLNLPTRRHQPTREKDLFEFLKEAELEHYYTALTTHLKVRSVEQIKYVEDTDLTELGFSRPEQRRLRKYFNRECPQTTMGKLRKRLSRSTTGPRSSSVSRSSTERIDNGKNIVDHSDQHGRSSDCTPIVSEDNEILEAAQPRVKSGSSRWSISRTRSGRGGQGTEDTRKPVYRVIPSDQLETGTSLGEGEFGRVCQGVWRPESGGVVQVAVKILELHRLQEDLTEFFKEIALMHQLNHPDIVRLYGVCVDCMDSIKIVTELAPLRSLLECLREPELRTSLPVPVLHRFAVQIARAMTYLEELGLVHRDLAARNVLVFSKDVVKLSDFGMSRALQLGKSYYQSNLNVNLKLPIAWCAPECIHNFQFTSSSDVWAYGVTLWELFTYGFTPWAGLTGRQILEAIDIPRATRLDQPDACPDAIYDAVMRACWTHESRGRPTFAQLLSMLPRLCPERWQTTRDYRPDTDTDEVDNEQRDDAVEDHDEHVHVFRSSGMRSLGRHLSVRANELVYVLGKRSSRLWKVITHQTGQIGCLPTAILKPYNQDLHNSKDVSVNSETALNNTVAADSGTLLASKPLLRTSRRASLSDLAFRKTVSRLTKLGASMGAGGSTHTGSRVVRLTGDRISLPQNDFRHIGHVGSDGRIFGDLGFSHNGSEDRPESSAVAAAVSEATPDTSSTQNEVSEIVRKQSPVPQISPRMDANSNATLPTQPRESFVVDAISEQTGFCSNQHPGVNGTDRVYGERADRSKPITETDIDSVGLTFGTSLLDEVFKCFSINGVAINGTHEPASGMDTAQQVDSSSLSDELATKAVSTIYSSSPINVTDDDRADLLSTRPKSRSRQNGLELTTSLPSSVPHSSPSRTSSNSSYRNMFSPTAVTECSDRVSRPTSRITDGDPAEDSSATPSLRSRWKRSTFGSLTRRSSSVSKVNGGAHSTGTLGRKGSEPPDSLYSNRRLTISRPILIGKPTVLCQSPDPAISDCRSSASTSCSTITSLNDHCSVSHESLGGLSATSRDSSLTMISSSNGYAPSNMEDENGLSDTVSYSSHARVNGDEVRSIYSCSMSPAQSLCSINAAGRANGVSVDRGVRVLRGGDMVFRAATNTAGGGGGSTLNTRRRVGAPMISSGYTNEARSTTTRLRNPYVPLQNKHRSPDYLSAGLGSNQLLSRLDGLTISGTTSAGPTTAARRTHDDLSTRMAGRRFSASSSSSSSSSVLSTPSPLVTSPARTHQDRVTGSTVRPQTTVTCTSGLTCNSSSNLGLLDGTIASFWGSTFADMLNDRHMSSDRERIPTLTGCFEPRASAIKPSVKPLLPDLSSGPSRAIARDDDDDVLAV